MNKYAMDGECTKCGKPFEYHHHRHVTRKGVYHTKCYRRSLTPLDEPYEVIKYYPWCEQCIALEQYCLTHKVEPHGGGGSEPEEKLAKKCDGSCRTLDNIQYDTPVPCTCDPKPEEKDTVSPIPTSSATQDLTPIKTDKCGSHSTKTYCQNCYYPGIDKPEEKAECEHYQFSNQPRNCDICKPISNTTKATPNEHTLGELAVLKQKAVDKWNKEALATPKGRLEETESKPSKLDIIRLSYEGFGVSDEDIKFLLAQLDTMKLALESMTDHSLGMGCIDIRETAKAALKKLDQTND